MVLDHQHLDILLLVDLLVLGALAIIMAEEKEDMEEEKIPHGLIGEEMEEKVHIEAL